MTHYLDTWSKTRNNGKLSFGQRVQLAFMPVMKTLIGTLDPSTLARQIDISHWDGDVDIARMVREGDIAMVFIKASDGKQVQSGDSTYPPNYVDDWLYRNIQKCYDAGIPAGVYHYVQPLPQVDYTVQDAVNWQMRVLHTALDRFTPKVSYHAIVLDVEQKDGTDPNASDVVLKMMDAIKADPKMSQVPLIIYTSISVLNFYKKLSDQVSYTGANKNLWMAQWVFNTVTTTSWADVITRIIPSIAMKVLTPGFANWKFLQWTSSLILPGCAVRLDLNFYNGTKEALYTFLGYKVVTPPPPTEPPTDPGQYVTVATYQADQIKIVEAIKTLGGIVDVLQQWKNDVVSAAIQFADTLKK
jgi:GH25 family lysozyme M1 (1,4-beta-N-acetylmuramidase)